MKDLMFIIKSFFFALQLTRLETELGELTSKNEKVEAEYEEVGKAYSITDFRFLLLQYSPCTR